ncbi:MAG: T9SS type A sorting domain-containing protein, partial [Flavobacteriales bacterium]
NLSAMSMHSYVFTIDTSLSSQVGNSSQEETKIVIFPNPTNSQLEISFPLTQTREIMIYNLNGVLVFNKKYQATKTLTIDVKSLAEGMYLIKSMSNSGQQITKFLIGNQ